MGDRPTLVGIKNKSNEGPYVNLARDGRGPKENRVPPCLIWTEDEGHETGMEAGMKVKIHPSKGMEVGWTYASPHPAPSLSRSCLCPPCLIPNPSMG